MYDDCGLRRRQQRQTVDAEERSPNGASSADSHRLTRTSRCTPLVKGLPEALWRLSTQLWRALAPAAMYMLPFRRTGVSAQRERYDGATN
jgi:hypothetical protein